MLWLKILPELRWLRKSFAYFVFTGTSLIHWNIKGELDKKVAWTLICNADICIMMDEELKIEGF